LLLNRFKPLQWHRLPRLLGVLNLIALRSLMREKNLYDTSQLPSRGPHSSPPWTPAQLVWRSPDGTYNDLKNPRTGCGGARFGRNIPLELAWPEAEPRLLEPSPRIVSNRLLARETFVPARSLNLLAAAWIQFMVHDWFDHGVSRKGNEFRVPLDTERDDRWHENPMRIRRTPPDPTRIPGADEGPPTYVNSGSHWWDASQIYGNNEQELRAVRCPDEGRGGCERGKLKLEGTDLGERLPMDSRTRQEKAGVTQNWWIGLSLVHTLFAKEHNAIVDRLRLEYPDWDGDQLFQTARLINTALLAKIHTLEWTPAILGHPTLRSAMNAHWWGMCTDRITRVFGRLSRREALSGIPGSSSNDFGVPYALTEEFVAIYRMHSLMPDTLRRYRVGDGRLVDEVELKDITGPGTLSAFDGGLTAEDLCYSFGIVHPGALVLHNYPNFLRNLERRDPDGTTSRIDLAAIDVMRDRERGIPRYNDFRKLMHLRPVRRFEDITRNAVWARQLREVYGDVDRVDLQVGMLAEDLRPQGFGFSDTSFRIFVLMASRRLTSDRFFTTDYNVNLYTRPGMDWINHNTMTSVMLRHYPRLAPALRQVTNAFVPWAQVARNPLS
jgi:hypothetical protein